MRDLRSFRVVASLPSEIEHVCGIEQPSLGSSSAVEGFLFSCSFQESRHAELHGGSDAHHHGDPPRNTGAYRGLIYRSYTDIYWDWKQDNGSVHLGFRVFVEFAK